MANNYLQFSGWFGVTDPAQRAEFMAIADEAEYRPCDIEETEDGFLLIAELDGDLESLSEIVARFQKKTGSTEPLVLSWATTCDKMRVNEFGGGTLLVYKGKTYWFNPTEQARKKLDNLKKHYERKQS